jgi:hypothetical protein
MGGEDQGLRVKSVSKSVVKAALAKFRPACTFTSVIFTRLKVGGRQGLALLPSV